MGAKQSNPANGSGVDPKQHQVQQHPSVNHMLTRAAHVNPSGIATIDHFTGRQHTWKEVNERVSRLANAFKTKYGLSEGGRIGLVSLNSDRYFEMFFAAPFAGGIIVPINIRLAPPEMVEQFNDCAAEIILVDDAFWQAVVPLVRTQCKSVKHIIFCGDKRPAGLNEDYESIITGTAPISEPARRGGCDTFGIFYTGGTTGKSKGVELTHSNIFINALGHVGMLDYTRDSRYLHSAPMVSARNLDLIYFELTDGCLNKSFTWQTALVRLESPWLVGPTSSFPSSSRTTCSTPSKSIALTER